MTTPPIELLCRVVDVHMMTNVEGKPTFAAVTLEHGLKLTVPVAQAPHITERACVKVEFTSEMER